MTTEKKIQTVARDIKELLVGVKTGSHLPVFGPEFLAKFGTTVAKSFKRTLSPEDKVRPPITFYASEIGSKCYRQLWYKYHQPSLAEPHSASMAMKYLYGGIIEEVVLRLAEIAGHKVEYEQESIEHTVGGINIRGRMDALIDGSVVDVKSVSSYGFKDFQKGLGGNKFGYKEQLEFYQRVLIHEGKVDPSMERGYIVVDKQLGHIEYCPDNSDWSDYVRMWKDLSLITSNPTEPPFARLGTITEGSNQKLGLECSYCSYKNECWKDANGGKGLRAFGYSNKVVFMTEVKKEPKVPEITKGTTTDVLNH